MKRDIWDSVTHVLQKRAAFEEMHVFLIETENFRPISAQKHSGVAVVAFQKCPEREIHEKHRFVHQSSGKKKRCLRD